MKTITVKFKYRSVGEYRPTHVVERVDIESDSTEKEKHEQIMWFFNRFINTTYVVNVYPYEILNQ